MTIGQLRSLLSAIVALFVLTTSSGSGQTEWHNIGGNEYGKYDGTWYALSNGSIGDRLDTSKILVLPKSVSEADLHTYLMEHLPQLRILGTRPGGFIAIQVGSNTDAMKVAKALESTGLFTSMFFNHFYRCSAVPNDPLYSSQWHLPKTFVPDAWQLATGNGTTIAVIDNGGDWEHEDLYGNLSTGIGFDFVDNDEDPYPGDGYGHGTACAGVIGAVTNNGTGVAGVAGGWGIGQHGIYLMHFRAGTAVEIDPDFAAEAVELAATSGVKVINMSFGGQVHHAGLEAAINEATNNHGVICVAASGNYYFDGKPGDIFVDYPAKYSNVIAVGAITESDLRKQLNDGTDEPLWGSRYGSELDLVAPGIHIPTTDITGTAGYNPGNYHLGFNGTSSAAPQVAAAIGLIRQINPGLTLAQIREVLINTADKLAAMGGATFHQEYGYGRLNVRKALKYVLEHFGGTVGNNLTIPSGETWNLASGITWTFSGNYKLRVEGTLVANGVTFTRSGGQWYGIEFYGAPSGSEITGCTIENTQCGVSVISSSSFYTQYCTIQSNSTGVYSSGSQHVLAHNYITDNSTGVDCENYSTVDFELNNWVKYNSTGIGIDATSTPWLGTTQFPVYCSIWGNDWDVWSNNQATISAQVNYWGSYPANPMIYGYIDYSNELSSEPSMKVSASLAGKAPSVLFPSNESVSVDTGGIGELSAAMRQEGRFVSPDIQDVYRSIITRYPGKLSGEIALVRLERSFEKQAIDPKAMLRSYSEIFKGGTFSDLANLRLAHRLIWDGKAEEALEIVKPIADAGGKFEREALYDVGSLLWYRLSQKPSGERYFRLLAEKYPDDPLTQSGLATLGEAPKVKQPAQPLRGESLPTSFFVEAAYPNPFNPSTQIDFALPKDGLVSLVVYDVLGREIAQLAHGPYATGYHSARWNAGSLASGVYYARLLVSDNLGNLAFTKVTKLLLAK